MKKVAIFATAALAVAMLAGCAKGRTPLDYETGTFVAPEKVQELKDSNATQAQVVKAIGYPNSKSEVGGNILWQYQYNLITAIPLVGRNKAEATVFEWTRAGKLIDAYKTNGGSGTSSNPLLNAAGM